MSGSVRKTGSVAYVPQEAWIFPSSLRQNILFGRAMEREWYERTLSSCGLAEDLAQLSNGDSSLVGDRGLVLSGIADSTFILRIPEPE